MGMGPVIVQKRAIDVTPYNHAIWCSVGGSEPFANQIVLRQWSENSRQIVVMLDSHNFAFWNPDELVDVVEVNPGVSVELFEKIASDDRKRMFRSE